MALHLINTLSNKKEIFKPLQESQVSMYVCGPTVYGLTHIGNARPAVFFDVVRRYLEFSGYKVKFISNFTDVDDKIIQRSREDKLPALEVAQKYIAEFQKDMHMLGVRPPDHTPRVTEFIPEIVSFIERLVEKGSAYATEDGEVFFSVRGFRGYGKLSKKNIDDLMVGARVDRNEKKRDPLDFSLWKPQKAEDEPAWKSPWGNGRPGWHIECSVMSTELLGCPFDIHGGGLDLIHPHHENEIAQSEALFDKPFANYWLHNNLITIKSEKMSKSVGNIFLTREFVNKYTAETLKLLLISGHYRSAIDFNQKHICDIQAALHRYYSALKKCQDFAEGYGKGEETSPEGAQLKEVAGAFPTRWKASMDDDLNTAQVIGCVFEYVRRMNAYLDRKGFKPSGETRNLAQRFLDEMKTLSHVLNVFGEDPDEYLTKLRSIIVQECGLDNESIEEAIAKRNKARQEKDFKTADAIRNSLCAKGIQLCDSPAGTTWDVTFSDD